MTAILALDLGSTTGFAYAAPGVFASGEWKLDVGRHVSLGARANELKRKINQLHQTVQVHEVWYEAVEFASTTYAAQLYGAFLGSVQGWCEEQGVPFRGVAVAALKKYATYRGNATKEDMVIAARSFGYDVPAANHNEADALCLLHYAMSEGMFA